MITHTCVELLYRGGKYDRLKYRELSEPFLTHGGICGKMSKICRVGRGNIFMSIPLSINSNYSSILFITLVTLIIGVLDANRDVIISSIAANRGYLICRTKRRIVKSIATLKQPLCDRHRPRAGSCQWHRRNSALAR